jgi:outer membrane protein assembly factor BamA
LKSLFLTIVSWLTFSQAICLGQQIIRVEWAESSTSEIKKIRNFDAFIEAEKLTDSVSMNFRAQGYLEGYFREVFFNDTLRLTWDFGQLFRWEKLNRGSVPEEFFKSLGKPGLNYQAPYLWIDRALFYAEDIGFPFAELKIDSLTIRDNLISGVLDYNSGPRITWDSLEIAGESKTERRYLQQLTGLIPGQTFSQKGLAKATQTIRKSPYFTVMGTPELAFQMRQAKPIFTLQDRRVNVFDGVLGLLPNENELGKVLITGEVDLQLYHLGGKGRNISLNWQRLNIQSQSLEIKGKEAFVFHSPLDVGVGFSLLKQDSSFVNRTFELDFGYRISEEGYLNFFTKRQAGDLISPEDIIPNQALPASIDYRWNQYGIGMEWNTLDSPVSPRKGSRIQGRISLGNKRILQNTGLPEELYDGLEESSAQYQGWFSGEKHLYIKPSWGMWLRGVGGFIQNQNLFLNELYRVGGLKSLRGFNEKNFFAKSFGYLNLEQRLFFDQNSFLIVFADLGIIENPYTSPKIDYPFSFGTGINLDTNGGLFSFVLAIGKSDTQALSFSYSRIHFGYLARF